MNHNLPPKEKNESERKPLRIGNFNDIVLVKITEHGERDWYDYYNSFLGEHPEHIPAIKRDDEGYTEMQLHEVAQVFGSKMYMGNTENPVEMTFKFVDPLDYRGRKAFAGEYDEENEEDGYDYGEPEER